MLLQHVLLLLVPMQHADIIPCNISHMVVVLTCGSCLYLCSSFKAYSATVLVVDVLQILFGITEGGSARRATVTMVALVQSN